MVAVVAAALVIGLSVVAPRGLSDSEHVQLAAGDETRWAAERAKAPFQDPMPGLRWNGGPGYATLYGKRRDDFVKAVNGDASAYARRHPGDRMLRLVRIETWRGAAFPPALSLGRARPFGGETGVRMVENPARHSDFYDRLVFGGLRPGSLVLYDEQVDAHYVCPPSAKRCEAVFVAKDYEVACFLDPDEAPSVRMEVADLRRALPRWLSPKPDL